MKLELLEFHTPVIDHYKIDVITCQNLIDQPIQTNARWITYTALVSTFPMICSLIVKQRILSKKLMEIFIIRERLVELLIF